MNNFGCHLITAGVFMGCQSNTPTDQGPSQKVVVSLSHPVGFLVDSLLDGLDNSKVTHQSLLPESEDAAIWGPTTDQVVELQQADLLVANGLGYEPWMKTTALPSSIVLIAGDGIEAIQIPEKTHSHGKGGAHSHGKDLPTVWLNPTLLIEMTNRIAERLQKVLPNEEAVKVNQQTLISELNQIEKPQ